MEINEFIFGDFDAPDAVALYAKIGRIVSINNYIEDQYRELLHEFLMIQEFDISEIIISKINSTDRKQKLLLEISAKFFETDDIPKKLKAFFAKAKGFSAHRNILAHAIVRPFRPLRTPESIDGYQLLKPSKDFFEKIDVSRLDEITKEAIALAVEANLMKVEVTILMKQHMRREGIRG